jgi:hypothetical protein
MKKEKTMVHLSIKPNSCSEAAQSNKKYII